jgi:excinuclease ABC subunit A
VTASSSAGLASTTKNIDLEIPGPAGRHHGAPGSGKSTLAFDTIYAEGQRRYVESRRPTPASSGADGEARRRLDRRPLAGDLDRAEDDVAESAPTVGTVTETPLPRVLYALGTPHCPQCGQVIAAQTVQQMVPRADCPRGPASSLALVVRGRKGEYRKLLSSCAGRVRPSAVNGTADLPRRSSRRTRSTPSRWSSTAWWSGTPAARLADSSRRPLGVAEGVAVVEVPDGGQAWVFSSAWRACAAASRSRRSRRGCSPSTTLGACPACGGPGTRLELDPDLVVPDPRKSLAKWGARAVGGAGIGVLPANADGARAEAPVQPGHAVEGPLEDHA